MERQDRDNRYSEPCYYDTEQGIWVNDPYEPIELPVTRNRLQRSNFCNYGRASFFILKHFMNH